MSCKSCARSLAVTRAAPSASYPSTRPKTAAAAARNLGNRAPGPRRRRFPRDRRRADHLADLAGEIVRGEGLIDDWIVGFVPPAANAGACVIAGGEEDVEIGTAALSLCGQAAAVATRQADIGEGSGRHNRQKPCGVRSADPKIEPTPRSQYPMMKPSREVAEALFASYHTLGCGSVLPDASLPASRATILGDLGQSPRANYRPCKNANPLSR